MSGRLDEDNRPRPREPFTEMLSALLDSVPSVGCQIDDWTMLRHAQSFRLDEPDVYKKVARSSEPINCSAWLIRRAAPVIRLVLFHLVGDLDRDGVHGFVIGPPRIFRGTCVRV